MVKKVIFLIEITTMNSNKKENIEDTWTSSRLPVFLASTGYTVLTIAILGGLGYWLDLQFGTKPYILIGGLVAAFPLSQVLVYKKIKKFANKKTK
jgi:F0F1-type ATP synthase assembly protein I